MVVSDSMACLLVAGLSVAAFAATMVLSSMAAADLADKSDPISKSGHSRATISSLISAGMLIVIIGIGAYLYFMGDGKTSMTNALKEL